MKILRHANAGKQRRAVDAETTPVRNPSTTRTSGLLELAVILLLDSPDLAKFAGRV